MTPFRFVVAMITISLILISRLRADDHPNVAAGADVNQVFQAGNLDNINLFNGSLTVTVPLGMAYHVGGNLSYHFILVANSSPWQGGTNQNNTPATFYSEPTHCTNAGLGWRVSFGNLNPCQSLDAASNAVMYEGPDGSQHSFYPNLHPNEPTQANVFYTRDGSYLRLRNHLPSSQAPNPPLNDTEIDFPNGETHHFDAVGNLRWIHDRFGNSIDFNLYLSGSACTGARSDLFETSCWKITDTSSGNPATARSHWIYFRSDLNALGDNKLIPTPLKNWPPNVSATYGPVVSRVVLAAFQQNTAEYRFNYSQVQLSPPPPQNEPNAGDWYVPMLSSVHIPDSCPAGTDPMGCSNYVMGYNIFNSSTATASTNTSSPIASGPEGFAYCASEGVFCNFPGETKDIAYGANGSFRVLANVHDLALCSVSLFGDPAPGVTKYCYIQDSGTGNTAGPGPSGYTLCGTEAQTCSFTGQIMDVAYGTNDVFRLITNISNSQLCSNTVFGDPMFGVHKTCYTKPSASGPGPSGYVFCSGDGGVCNFPGATKDVAYGANGSFRVLANVHDLANCTVNLLGDPAPGVSKACYIKDSGTGSTAGPGPSNYTLCGTEGQTCSFSGQTMDIAYGTNDVFRLITKVSNSQLCSYTVFGDPMIGVQKACYSRPSSALPPGAPVGYLWCADEYANCVFSSPQTIAFGANGSFIYLLNVNGTVSCTSSNFGGDPAPGLAKNCYSAPYGTETGQGFSGSLNTLQLPAGGAIQWAYGYYSFPAQSAGPRPARSRNAGVVTRVVLDQTGAHTWTYQSHVTGPVNPPPGEVVNTVTDSLGNVTKRYFSVSLVDNPSGNGIYDYGRQYTPNSNTPNSTLGNLFLSEEYFDSAGNLVYRKYARFERDQVVPGGSLPDAGNDNGRMAQQTTVYADSTQAGYTDSDFDGVGHYRFRQTYGTGFESAGQPDSTVRNVVTHYNPSLATYSAPNNNPPLGYQPPSASGLWVLTTLDYTSTADNSTTFKQSFVYDTTTGFLCAQRIYTGTGGNDLFRLFIPDGNGNVATEASFGGDRNPASQSFSLGCQSPAQGAEYIVDYTYQNGALRSTQYRGAGFLSVDRTIDLNTGLPQSSRDTAGIQTIFQYDVLGRLTFVKPRDTAWTVYNYVGAIAGSTQPTLTIQQFPNGNLSSPPLTFTRHHFDLLGRVQATDVHMADGTASTRAFTYDALGRQSTISELGATTQATRYTYDPLGRVSSVTAADGKTTSYQYNGIQQVTRNYSVAGAGGVSSKEKFDRFGQLVEVDQPSGTGGAVVATRYTYNAGGRMIQASTTGAEGQQTRTFHYDGRGFLLSQTQPEITASSPSGNSVDYGHDSRGHLVTQAFGNGEAYSYWYDLAERLTNVCIGSQQCGTPLAPCPNTSLTCLKEFIYDQGTNGLGKVFQASRFNHPALGTSQHVSKITYTYTYAGVNGWISARNLFHTFDGQTGSSQEAFNQSFAWNQLGYLDNETYPNCAPSFVACSGSSIPPPSRTVSYAYTNGMLTDVTGYTLGPPGITYNPNGTVHQVTHANGVVATYAMDPNNMPRVSSIAASGPGGVPLWNSGNYAYDGQGNISTIGNSSFAYDGVSRISSAYMQTDPNINSSAFAASSQYFCYDSFGNLLGIQGASGCANPNLPTYSSNNQLQAAAYNTRGNLIQWNGASYSYEGDQSKLQHFQSGQEQWFFMYDADDERVWQVGLGIPGLSGQLARWSLRGLDGKVRREFNVPSYQWGTWNTPPTAGGAVSWWRDLIYRGNAAMADILSNGYQRYLDVDHLGSVRLTTNSSGTQDGYHVYFPFGQEAVTGGEVPAERLKLAGTERYLGEAGTSFLLDYMHARDTSPNLGRFLTPDVGFPNPGDPLSWNGYSYVLNNPVNLVDPGGHDDVSSQPCDVGGDNGTCDQEPASSNDIYDLSGIPPDLIAEALAGNTDDTIIVVDDTITVTAHDPGPNAADVLRQERDWLEGLIRSGKDLLRYLVNKPWAFSVIIPLIPEPELGFGPAGAVAYDPQSHTFCLGGGVGASAGHNVAGGPLTGGGSFSSTPWPQNAPDVLGGWSVGVGANAAGGPGGQFIFNSSGWATGYTAGVPGISVAVTNSGCTKLY